THIEMSLSKDQSLTIMVTGKTDAVMQARRELLSKLQTQANVTLSIPKEHHRFILGKHGAKLKDLELNTATKISIPRTEDNSDVLRITGTRDGIDKAKHEIQLISEEQSKLAFERLRIEKPYHPFITGPNNKNVQELSELTGARINVPPPSVMKDEIVVSGEKEGVMAAIHTIMTIYEEKKRKTTTVSLEVRKSQHKYVIGPRGNNIQEILAKTGVSVELPPTDSPSETITLRGEQDKLGPAITQVYAKANSIVIVEVRAPAWLHKFIIGRKGQNIRSITQNLPKVHVEFEEGKDTISVEGPPEEVEQARKALDDITQDLQSRFVFAEIEVDPKYHRHIIGKSGANVSRIKEETGVSIHIPGEEKQSRCIRIEGSPEGVTKAKNELLEMVRKMENEKTKDIVIEQRFHRTMIGTQGNNIRDIRDKFNQVSITFPDPGRKSDVVTLRGPRQDVDKCYRFLHQLNTEMVANNYKVEIPIFKKFHKNIIGKGGATISKIKDETDTRIEIPSEDSDSDVIIIIGKKPQVELARDKIQAIQKELANVTQLEISIASKYHQSLIGAKGRLVRSIMEDCGGVMIHFPNEGSGSDKVTLRGPKDDVDKAKKQLMELANERESQVTVECIIDQKNHRTVMGAKGSKVQAITSEYEVGIKFPDRNMNMNAESNGNNGNGEPIEPVVNGDGGSENSEDDKPKKCDTIIITGKQDNCDRAKAALLALVPVTEEVTVPFEFHRFIIGVKGAGVRRMMDDHDVSIMKTCSS
ncbi:vigilin-like, partial [Saccoglossus kowalevskii]